MTLDFLNDVFRLNLALEPAQGTLQRFAVMQSNFCQTDTPKPELTDQRWRIHVPWAAGLLAVVLARQPSHNTVRRSQELIRLDAPC